MYAELHCHSNFSFLDGASHPEELAEEAARLGLAALAITDHDGFYGVVRFAEAARPLALPTVFGAELTLGAQRARPTGSADPPGEHLIVLAQGPVGYARLAKAISEAQLAGEKGAPRTSLAAAGRRGPGAGARPRPEPGQRPLVRAHRLPQGNGAGRARPRRPGRGRARVARAGRRRSGATVCSSSCGITAIRSTGTATTRSRRSRCASGSRWSRRTTCTTPRPARRPLAQALAAVRARRSLDEIDGWLPAAPFAHLRSAAEQQRRFARWPGAVERTVEIALRVRVRPEARRAPAARLLRCPTGHDEMSWLRELVRRGAAVFYPESAPAARAGDATDRLRADVSSSSSASPATSCCCTTSSSSAAAPTSTARGGGARRTARSVTRSVSPRPTRSRSGCCSNGSCRPNATVRPTSTSTSSTSAAKR